jgi:hypothetical protein
MRRLIAEAKGGAVVTAIIRELLKKHWKEHPDLPIPTIKLVNQARAAWLGRCSWRQGQTNTQIEVQRRVMEDPKTLRRVLAHEMIHHWEFLTQDQTRALALAKMRIPDRNAHGPIFMAQAKRINGMEGPDYVAKDSDQSYDTSRVPKFYILIQPHIYAGKETGKFGFTISLRPSAKAKAIIADKQASLQARLFRITDGEFFSGAAPIKKYGGYSLPKDAKKQGTLHKMYNSGHQLTL